MAGDGVTENRWTSRKFWAAMLWQTVFVALLWHGKLPPDVFEGVTWLVLGAYFAANVGDKFARRN